MFPFFTPRLLVIAGTIAAFLAVLGGLYVKGRSDQAARDRAAVAASREQARVSDVTAKAVDTFHTETIVIREREARNVAAVQKAPGADTPIDPDLLRVWRDGLRDIETSARGGDNPAKPADTLPPT